VIDTSALLAVLSGAAEVEAPAGRMAEAPILQMSAASLLEACLVAAGSRFSTASDGLARARNMPVHYKGSDFADTDVQSIGPQR